MKIFVASWFFPPATSSEGIVTYKLLRNSKYEYDVFSSTSKQWGYKASMNMQDDPNIHSFTIQTDSIDEWVNWCIEQFKKRHAAEKYACIMTRSTPPESILVGKAVKELYPDVKWVASLADPIANNPYELKAYVDDSPVLGDRQKSYLKTALRSENKELVEEWLKYPSDSIKLLCTLKQWENVTLEKADVIISPTARQLKYINEWEENSWNHKFFAVPHSFDDTFYSKKHKADNDKVVLSFLGYSDKLRSLKPIVEAVNRMKQENDPALEKLVFRLIGNNPREIQDTVLNDYLEDYVIFSKGVDYYQSLELMEESDWLIHVDADFPELIPGGSIFFAGKLADYMGAKKPILGITGRGTPAYNIIQAYGGECVLANEQEALINLLGRIARGYVPKLDFCYRDRYDAKNVAAMFDRKMDELCGVSPVIDRIHWPVCEASKDEKLLTVCVPSYNAQRFLDRCLYTLINHSMAPFMEVLIINDGSVDRTAEIGHIYEERYPGIIRLISKENGGHGSTINRAIEEAKGLYFRNVDSDDWVDSQQLETLLLQIQSGQISSDVISSNYHEVDLNTSKLTPITQECEVEYGRVYRFEELPLDKIYITMHSMTVRTKILKNMHARLQEHTFYVDVEYILFPVPYFNSIVFTNGFIYKYSRGRGEQSVAIPNMVNRYDQHCRVLKRVIVYAEKTSMNPSQKNYYDEIVKRVLCTHYLLSLFYDDDKQRGCERAKEFDHFLYKNRPDLAEWIGKKMLIVSVARRCHYDPVKIKHSATMFIKRNGEQALIRMFGLGRQLANTDLARKLVYNQFSISIAQSEFFSDGIGKKAKDKVNSIFGM